MRYAIFSDIHANLEALEAVLEKIDEIAREAPIDQIWFLGDLVGYGPDPNACIMKLRERTDVIIAGNHDWAAVGKIDLEDFSAAARISAEWTAEQLTEEHRAFLIDLPERLQMDECTLVHGSPFGPLWEYLTSEVLAERSFQHFSSRYCFVGHTHLPTIFIQPAPTSNLDYIDAIANAPTVPLAGGREAYEKASASSNNDGNHNGESESSESGEPIVAQTSTAASLAAGQAESAYAHPETGQPVSEAEANILLETRAEQSDANQPEDVPPEEESAPVVEEKSEQAAVEDEGTTQAEPDDISVTEDEASAENAPDDDYDTMLTALDQSEGKTSETDILNAEDRLNSEIEELLALLGLSESLVQVTNEMLTPPEGAWQPPEGYRAIINPGGVGQPRDGDPRAAFMIYDSERGFEFYRVSYAFEKTQEKIIKAGLPHYLAVRLAYGR
jgi:diadenosine tetraphosphatase ApaH/serine/threonine PP2A family protein phosphatase